MHIDKDGVFERLRSPVPRRRQRSLCLFACVRGGHEQLTQRLASMSADMCDVLVALAMDARAAESTDYYAAAAAYLTTTFTEGVRIRTHTLLPTQPPLSVPVPGCMCLSLYVCVYVCDCVRVWVSARMCA
jgi:hypothetical protein